MLVWFCLCQIYLRLEIIDISIVSIWVIEQLCQRQITILLACQQHENRWTKLTIQRINHREGLKQSSFLAPAIIRSGTLTWERVAVTFNFSREPRIRKVSGPVAHFSQTDSAEKFYLKNGGNLGLYLPFYANLDLWYVFLCRTGPYYDKTEHTWPGQLRSSIRD